MLSLDDINAKYQREMGVRSAIQKTIKKLESDMQQHKRTLKNTEDAQVIAQTVAMQTQQELEYSISDIVTTALDAVFGDGGYEFKVEFVPKRNKTEAEIYFTRGGVRVDPMDSAGGGAVDVAAFALRLALWNLRRPRSCNTIVLDEPFRFVSRDYQARASAMLKMLSDKMDIQFIVVTHSQDIIDSADKIFEVKISKRGVSHVKEIA